MKTKIITLGILLAVAASFSFALPGKPETLSTRKIDIHHFTRLYISKNIDVVLVQSCETKTITVVGNENDLPGIVVTSTEAGLSISSTKNLGGKKVRLYVPVNNLAYIELGEGAQVSTQGTLLSPSLSVLVDEGSFVSINNLGTVDINSKGNAEFVYQVNEQRKVVMVTH